MKKPLLAAALLATVIFGRPLWAAETSQAVKVTTGTITMPTYEQSGRELQPPLFPSSAVSGIYPFPTYKFPLKPGPKAQKYEATFVENEYLKLTYLPEFGGRFLELYDKLRHREVFYKNDVLKPTQLNPRGDWPQEGIELTGPYDVHSLTMHFDPYWSNTILHNPDGSVTIRLGEVDPIYGMTVRYSATLHPGVAALEISTFCFNPNDIRKPQMFWSNASFPTTPETRFLYPMTRTVGHNTGQVTDWPIYEGVDYSWDRNNKNMLGVFGIDLYDNFGGAYMYDQNYGVFRFADRRVVQGMKMWTFGHGRDAASMQAAYTDKAGPYYEAQSGRHVWDGHYEWVDSHQVEQWSEWWVPVGGTDGLSTLTRDVALNMQVRGEGAQRAVDIALSPVVSLPGAKLTLRAGSRELLKQEVSLRPGEVFHKQVPVAAMSGDLRDLRVLVQSKSGETVLDYAYPNPGEKRSEYTAFTRELEKPQKSVDEMSAEELVLAAESRLKDLDDKAALDLLDASLKRDKGYSAAHTLKGIVFFSEGKLAAAESELKAAVDRDPYADRAWYYLSVVQLAAGKQAQAERNLYYVWPHSAFYGNREYQLGRIELRRGSYRDAVKHLEGALNANAQDLSAMHLLAMAHRLEGNRAAAQEQIDQLLKVDPSSRMAYAESFLLDSNAKSEAELKRLMGYQTQEALHVAAVYGDVERWDESAKLLGLLEQKNSDPWGTSSVYYYTLAYFRGRAGDAAGAESARKKAREVSTVVDRFPYLASSEAPLRAAIQADPSDATARYDLACLLYSLGRTDEAMQEWKSAESVSPKNFSIERSLGMAYAEQGDTKGAVAHLENAVALDATHIGTVNDLVAMYAQAGRFDDELTLLQRALSKATDKDDLMLRLLQVNLIQGRYGDAEKIVQTHTFSPRHRDYNLREAYRALRYAEAAQAFHKAKYADAFEKLKEVEAPPSNLGVDDFQFQMSARMLYARGVTLEKLGRKAEANKAFEESIKVVDLTAGDRASYNSDNFYMLLSMEKLGRKAEALELAKKFEAFAESQLTLKRVHRRAEGKYLQAQIAMLRGDKVSAAKLIKESLEIEPNFLMPRFDQRQDSIGTSL